VDWPVLSEELGHPRESGRSNYNSPGYVLGFQELEEVAKYCLFDRFGKAQKVNELGLAALIAPLCLRLSCDNRKAVGQSLLGLHGKAHCRHCLVTERHKFFLTCNEEVFENVVCPQVLEARKFLADIPVVGLH